VSNGTLEPGFFFLSASKILLFEFKLIKIQNLGPTPPDLEDKLIGLIPLPKQDTVPEGQTFGGIITGYLFIYLFIFTFPFTFLSKNNN